MLWIALIFIGFIVVFTLLLKFALTLLGKVAGRQIGAKHRAAEEIVKEGRVPKSWTSKLEKQILSKHNSPEMEDKAKRKILRRLDNLIEHFKKSPLVEGKKTRKILLNKLKEAHKSWEEKKWEDIVAR